MISICFNVNWANLCILTKIHSYLQSLITISPKAFNSTLTIQEIPRPTDGLPDCRKTKKKFSPFFKELDNEVINSQFLSSRLRQY